MVLNHLRRNVVAYLALVIALSTGTAYAAGLANGSVTTKKLAKNAVTSAKIKKNAVKSADVRNGALRKADLAAGVVPGAAFVAGAVSGENDPSADPDAASISDRPFTLPNAGTLLVQVAFKTAAGTCTSGPGHVGLYVDDDPVPGSRHPLTSTATALEILGTIKVGGGAHVLTLGMDCPAGNPITSNLASSSYFLVLGK